MNKRIFSYPTQQPYLRKSLNNRIAKFVSRAGMVLLLAISTLAYASDDPIGDPKCVLVKGFVKKSGPIEVTSGLTLTSALRKAGGFAEFADHHVLIWRSVEGRYINANEYAIRDKRETDPPLQKGDVVIVGQRNM
jgi:hypothetical protein